MPDNILNLRDLKARFPSVHRALVQFELDASEYAFIGAQPPEDHGDIVRRYEASRAKLIAAIFEAAKS